MTSQASTATAKVFLDTNFLISLVIDNDRYHTKAIKFQTKMTMQNGRGHLTAMVINEVLYICLKLHCLQTNTDWGPKAIKKNPSIISSNLDFAKKAWGKIKGLVNSGDYKILDCNVSIIDEVISIMERYNLAPTDAFHMAYASLNCKDSNDCYVIITGDSDFTNVSDGKLKAINYRC